MKQVYIFVEGPTDAEFLRRVLPPELLKDAEIVPAGGSSGIPSLARTVLVRRKKPVVVVMDADSIDPDLIEERRESTEDLIRAADASVPLKVVTVVPEIEAWLFAAPEVIVRALGVSVSNELVQLGRRDPRGVLEQLAEKNQRKWDSMQAIGLLDAQDIDKIRALPEVSELSAFLKNVQKNDKAA
jgi:predicted ATP-dependent endonuclease of OLD family